MRCWHVLVDVIDKNGELDMYRFAIAGLLATSIVFGMSPALAGDRGHKRDFRAEYRHEHRHSDRNSYRDDYRYYQRHDHYRDHRFGSHNNGYQYRKHYKHPGNHKNHGHYRKSASDDYLYIIGGAVLLNEILHHSR